ncbi:hypothetical protein HPB49_020081 [Dermacentor silvarum]|uniref:Uncharacterized protein n=1 Tax=Dermacentor silvarum TaxID=543639 RepID=A0ACB8CHB0_DERSI|nr:hypothetical protein HPB49_020081 [Dermacentor silvarum]
MSPVRLLETRRDDDPSGLSTERKVLCALRFFGTGSFQKSVGREEHIGMAQSAVSNTIHEVTEAIISVSVQRKLVDFSLTPAAKDEAKAAFARRGAIPGVLACGDDRLIAIMKPEGLSPADTASFVSRKGYDALNREIPTDVFSRLYLPPIDQNMYEGLKTAFFQHFCVPVHDQLRSTPQFPSMADASEGVSKPTLSSSPSAPGESCATARESSAAPTPE